MASFQGENGADDAPVECEVPGYRTTYAILTPGRPGARARNRKLGSVPPARTAHLGRGRTATGRGRI